MTDLRTGQPAEAAPVRVLPWYSMAWSLIASEPVAAQALVQASLVMVGAFGLHLTVEQIASVNVFVAAGLGFVLRRHVVPLSKLPPQGDAQ